MFLHTPVTIPIVTIIQLHGGYCATMADKLTLAVSNRARSGTIKKLPASIDVTTASTIEELQQKLAKASGVRDYNRIGIFDPVTRKIIRDRLAVLGAQDNVVKEKAILAQDLGEFPFFVFLLICSLLTT